MIGREPKIRKNTQGNKQKRRVIEQLVVSNSAVLNQELNWGSADWNKEAESNQLFIKCNELNVTKRLN